MSTPFFGVGGILTLASVMFVIAPHKEVRKNYWVHHPDWRVSVILLWVAVAAIAMGALLSHMRWEWKA